MYLDCVSIPDLSAFKFSSNQTCLRNFAPVHNTGAKWVDMLKPKRDANQSIAMTATGTSNNSVWCRKGSSL